MSRPLMPRSTRELRPRPERPASLDHPRTEKSTPARASNPGSLRAFAELFRRRKSVELTSLRVPPKISHPHDAPCYRVCRRATAGEKATSKLHRSQATTEGHVVGDEWVVEHVLDRRIGLLGFEYKVRWQSWADDWEEFRPSPEHRPRARRGVRRGAPAHGGAEGDGGRALCAATCALALGCQGGEAVRARPACVPLLRASALHSSADGVSCTRV